jgi:hypothetical protein
MIRDTLRAVLVVATLAAAAAIAVEARYQLAAIDIAHRATIAGHAAPVASYAPTPTPSQPGRLRQFGRAALELADAAIGIVR